jgi:hypothetical protein
MDSLTDTRRATKRTNTPVRPEFQAATSSHEAYMRPAASRSPTLTEFTSFPLIVKPVAKGSFKSVVSKSVCHS